MTPLSSGGPGLVLVGARATGKTTVGRILAERLARPFVDTDEQIEARAGRSIAELFARAGEARFRDLEESVLASMEGIAGAIVATGGGIVLRPANRDRLRALGRVVWLTATPETLATRLRADPSGLSTRPALTAQGTLAELATVLAAREPLYRAIADLVIDTTGKTSAEVAAEVLEAWDLSGASSP
jgi:shikimate kinase